MTNSQAPGPAVERDPRILLGAYAAKRCAYAVHNRFDSTVPDPKWTPDPDLQQLFDDGIQHEHAVFARLRQALGDGFVDLSEVRSTQGRIAGTSAAMDAGALVIGGGQLPNDLAGHRTGKPDLLLRWAGVPGPATYVPGDVKLHRVAGRAKTKAATVSRLGTPVERFTVKGATVAPAGSIEDALQLAHYTRMLQAIGRHPGDTALTGAILGSDDLSDLGIDGSVLVWLRLDDPVFRTFSRRNGRKHRTALERYDHEHTFRVKVAEHARRRSSEATSGVPLIRPVYQPECDTCQWWTVCSRLIPDDDVSLVLETGRLTIREVNALADRGAGQAAGLALVDLSDQDWLDSYFADVAHLTSSQATARLSAATTRAQMLLSDLHLVRVSDGDLEVPHADIEIDLDMENDVEQRVYLWGARKRSGGHDNTAEYLAFLDAAMSTGAEEQQLAEAVTEWLRHEIATAHAEGASIKVFHHSPVEPQRLHAILGDSAADVTAYFVDLHPWLKEHFIGRAGLGLKPVATALGFTWRDDDPGGRQSQVWLEEARSRGPHGRPFLERILRYNEDDVRATAWVRDHITGWADVHLS